MEHQGFFCTIEGGDGSGKSTLIKSLGARLESYGKRVLITREPGGCALGEAIRDLLLEYQSGVPICGRAELLLFLAARAQHVHERLMPALASGCVILCDRYHDSSIAYQAFGRGVDLGDVEALCAMASCGLQPQLTFYLDLPVELALQRAHRRDVADRIESEDVAFHQRCRSGFLEIAKRDPERVMVLDAIKRPEQIVEEAWQLLIAHMK